MKNMTTCASPYSGAASMLTVNLVSAWRRTSSTSGPSVAWSAKVATGCIGFCPHSEGTDPIVRAQGLCAMAELAFTQGNLEEASSILELADSVGQLTGSD